MFCATRHRMEYHEFIIKERSTDYEKLYTLISTYILSYFSRIGATVILIFLLGNSVHAQNAFLPLSNPVQQIYDPYINRVSSEMHTSVKPYLLKDVQAYSPYDTLNRPVIRDTKFTQSLVGRKLFREHLLSLEQDDYKIYVDPVFEFSGLSPQFVIRYR